MKNKDLTKTKGNNIDFGAQALIPTDANPRSNSDYGTHNRLTPNPKNANKQVFGFNPQKMNQATNN